MPWQNDGDYYRFCASEIEARAPAGPGVYGLYNFRHHITIASSDNIRETLLYHLRQTDFRFRRFQPTGFTFERWPSDLKNARAQQLIFEYNPVMQSVAGIGLRSLLRSWITPGARAFQIAPGKPASDASFYGQRLKFAPAICGVVVLVAALFTLIPDLPSSARGFITGILSAFNRNMSVAQALRTAAVAHDREALRVPKETVSADERMASEEDHRMLPDGERATDSPPAENSAALVIRVPSPDPVQAIAPASRPNYWTVQVFAAPDRKTAASWMERLDAKGYDVFVTEAEIGGKKWYRVRLGHFNSRADAQRLAGRVRADEGFDDAFVTLGARSEAFALKRDRR